MIKEHILVFDLGYDEVVKHHIPIALIVEKQDDKLGYVVKIANSETLSSYAINIDTTVKELLLLSDRIHSKSLYKRYNAKHKVAKPLEVLLEDAMFKEIIFQYIHRTLEKFLKLIATTEIPISLNFEKSNVFEKYRVYFSAVELEPKLYFNKMQAIIQYRLQLINGDKELIPSQENIIILLDQPSFVVCNQQIHRLKYINANKLKPFLSKEVVKIPNSKSEEYFTKFIKKIIKKAPIEAEGFDVVHFNSCTRCIIKPTTTIFSKVYYLELYFVYKNHTFSILDQNQKYIQLQYNNKGEFTVFETQRNKAQEEVFVGILKSLGVDFLDQQLATFSTDVESLDIYHNISKLIKKKDYLKSKSIEIDLALHGFEIDKSTSTISTGFTEKNDWFDVEMTIETGGFTFQFSHLIPHLKTGERLYQLPNGSHFLIPIEWFSRYKSLVNLGQVKKGNMTIQKNQFTLLEEAKIAKPKEINKDVVPYQPTGNIQAKLRPYQKEGVNWLVKNYQLGLGSCLADDMGLGKTLQALTYLDFVFTCFENDFTTVEAPKFPQDLFSTLEIKAKRLKALIVSPSSLTFNWNNEAQKFCPHFSCLRYIGTNRQPMQNKIPNYDLVFTSYGTLLRDIDFLKTQSFNFIIIDESQQIKNRNSKIYKAINTIQAGHKVSLSGTPIENSLSDLWSQMQFINPNLLGSYPFFNRHFKNPIEKEQDQGRVHALKTLIDPYLLRRTKSEVAKDLPELSEQIYYAELATEQARLYEEEKSKVRNYISESKLAEGDQKKKGIKISVLNALMKLRQLANHPKMIGEDAKSGKFEDVVAYLETLLRSKQKALIFSSFTAHLKFYTNWCDEQGIKYNLLTGQTKVKDREAEVADFDNNEESLLFFISLKAGGTGLNLTQASYVIILDPWWNPFAELQAIGRAHRIGQTQKVNVIRFISKQTIEEKINRLQQTKKEISDSIIEAQITDEILSNIDAILD